MSDYIPTHKTINFLFQEKSFSFIFKDENGINSFEKINLSDLDTSSKINAIKNYLELHKEFFSHFSFADVCIVNQEFSLIPLEYFEEETAEDFLNFNTSASHKYGLRFNIIPQHELAVVFYYLEELETIISEFFENFRISHTAFKFLTQTPENAFGEVFYINFYSDYFEVSLFINKNLNLYNIYPYQSKEDIAYFLTLLVTKFRLDKENLHLFYFGETKDKILNFITKFIKNTKKGTDDTFERKHYTLLGEL